MISGIVTFEEVLENVKDLTNIVLNPHYEKIRRFILKVEQDIGYGGLIVLKQKEYEIGNDYNGNVLKLPEDFIFEDIDHSLNVGRVHGNLLYLKEKGPDKLYLNYRGFLLDENGNPYTTRHHLEAVVAFIVYRLYSPKMFMGTGNMNMYLTYRDEYNDAVLAARGNSAFPTEQDWYEIGKIMNGGFIEAMTNCGMALIDFSSNNTYYKETEITEDIYCIYPVDMKIDINTSSVIDLFMSSSIVASFNVDIETGTFIFAEIEAMTSPEMAMYVTIDCETEMDTYLIHQIVTINCNESFNYSGSKEVFEFMMNVGPGIGVAGIECSPYALPDRFMIEYDGQIVADSKFIGSSITSYVDDLIALGYTMGDIDLLKPPTKYPLLFSKNEQDPQVIKIIVDAPLGGTQWRVYGVCPALIQLVGTSLWQTGIKSNEPGGRLFQDSLGTTPFSNQYLEYNEISYETDVDGYITRKNRVLL